jgi:hypothetical protein
MNAKITGMTLEIEVTQEDTDQLIELMRAKMKEAGFETKITEETKKAVFLTCVKVEPIQG